MTIVPLASYLRMYRKRTGFTHEEMAFLCGGMCGSSVARHENDKRLPVLRTALMYEFILQASVAELYRGIFHDVRATVRQRAKGMCASLERKPRNPTRDHKIALLRNLLLEESEISVSAT